MDMTMDGKIPLRSIQMDMQLEFGEFDCPD